MGIQVGRRNVLQVLVMCLQLYKVVMLSLFRCHVMSVMLILLVLRGGLMLDIVLHLVLDMAA